MTAVDHSDARVDSAPPQPGWLRRLTPWAVALVGLSILVAVMFRPIIGHCDERVLGAPGDATAGGVWTAWNYSEIPGPPWEATTRVTGAPTGERWWQPQFTTGLGVFAPLWLGGNLISPACTWNLTMAGAFLVTGMAVFALARWLTRRTDVALLAAVAYTFSPYRQLKAEGHIAYVITFGFPALVYFSIRLWERPTIKRVLGTGLSLATLGYIDGYYLLIGGVAFAALHGSALVYTLLARQTSLREIGRRVGAVVGAAGCALVALAPIALTYLSSSAALGASLTRSSSDIVQYAARPWEYVLPMRTHPVFGSVFGDWQDRHLHGSNFSEQSLFIGWVVLAGIAAAAILFLRSRRWRGEEIRPGLSRGLVVAMLFGLLLTATAFAAPATTYIGSHPIPFPSRVVYHFIKLWRVYARFFVVLHLGAVLLASLVLADVTTKLSRQRTRQLTLGLVAALVLFESAVGWSPQWWTFRASPDIYRFVKQQPGDVLAEYPLEPISIAPNNEFLTWQVVHEKQLFNVRNDGTPQAALRRGLFGLGDPQTIPVLRRLGVDLVVVRPDNYRGPITTPAPDGVELIRRFSYAASRASNPALRSGRWPWLADEHNADLYEIADGPRADVALAIGPGVYDPEPRQWTSFAWMETTGTLELVPLGGTGRRVTVSFELEPAFGIPRVATIWQGKTVLATVSVDAAGTPVEVEALVDAGPLTITSSVPAREIGAGDTRTIALAISKLGTGQRSR